MFLQKPLTVIERAVVGYLIVIKTNHVHEIA